MTERREDVETAKLYLSRVGLDKVRGYLCEGIDDWKNRGMPLEQSGLYTVDSLHGKLKEEDLFVLDVREKEEYAEGHIPGAVNIYVESLRKELRFRQTVLWSLYAPQETGPGLERAFWRAGVLRMCFNLIGGTTAWKEKGYSARRGHGE